MYQGASMAKDKAITSLISTNYKLQSHLDEKQDEQRKLEFTLNRKENAFRDLIKEIGNENANDLKTLKFHQFHTYLTRLHNLRDTKEKLKKTLLDLKNAVNEKETIIYDLEQRLKQKDLEAGRKLRLLDMEIEERVRLTEQVSKDIDHCEKQIAEEKERLRARETEVINVQKKISSLEAELAEKDQMIARSQGDLDDSLKQLYSQNVMIDTLKLGEEKTDIERRELSIEIEQARLEKDELLKRLDALNEMNAIRIGEEQLKIESMNLQALMKKRLVAGSVIFYLLGKCSDLQKREAFSALFSNSREGDYKLLAANSIFGSLERVAQQTRTFIFKNLKYDILNWPKARDINDNISYSMQENRIKTWAYGIWRKKFNSAFIKDLRKNIAITFLEQTLKEQDKRKLNYYTTKWYKQALYQRRVRIFLRHLIWRQHILRVRRAFETWSLGCSNFRGDILTEIYLGESKNFKILYSYFHALRKHTEDEKKGKNKILKVFFNSWKRTCRVKEAQKNLHKFFELRSKKMDKMRLYYIFQCLKQEAVRCKTQKVNQQISEVNEQNREIITTHIDLTRSANIEQRRKASNMILMLLSSKPLRALLRWRKNASDRTFALKAFWHKVWSNWEGLKANAFSKWLSHTLQHKREEVHVERRQEEEVQTELELQISRHRTLLEEYYVQEKDVRTHKLGELLQYIDNRIMRKGFRKYMLRARRLRKEEILFNNMFEYIEKSAYRKGFNGIRLIAHHKEIDEHHQRLLRKSNLQREFLLQKVTFDSWRDFMRIVMQFKIILKKFDIRVERMLFKRKFHKWATYAHAMHEKELKKRIQDAEVRKAELEKKLHGDIQTNVENLEYIERRRNSMQKVSAYLTKRIGFRDRIHMLRHSFEHWKDYKNFLNSVDRGLDKIVVLFQERNVMGAFDKLNRNKHYRIVRELNGEIDKISSEKKSLRIDYQKFVEEENKHQAERADQINKLEMDLIALQKKKDNFILNYLMRNQRVFNDKLITSSFSFWKFLYKSHKASAIKLSKAINHALLRKAMERLELKRYIDNRSMSIVLRMGRLEKIKKGHSLFSAFMLWRTKSMETKIQILEDENKFVGDNLAVAKKNSVHFRETIIEANKKRKEIRYKEHLFHYWKAKTQSKKDFNFGVERVKAHLGKLKASYYINELKDRMHKRRVRKVAFHKFREIYNSHLLVKYFNGFKIHLQNIRVFALCLYRFKAKLENTWAREALQQVSAYGLKKHSYEQSDKLRGCLILKRVLDLKVKGRLVDGFGVIDTYYHYLLKRTRVFVTRLDYVYQQHARSVFNNIYLWGQAKYNVEKNKIMGPMADRIRRAAVKLGALKKFFKDEGYDDATLKLQIRRGEEKRLGMLRAGISKLRLNSANNLTAAKAVNSWKEFAQNSKKVKKFRRLLLNFLEKPRLFQSFRKWNRFSFNIPEVSKEELLQASKAADKEIKQLVTLRDTKWELCQVLDTHTRALAEFEPGVMRMALLVLKRSIKKTMSSYWTHWNKFVAFCKEEDYNKLYDEASERILDLRNQIKAKKQELDFVSEHNYELKKIIFESTKTTKDLRALMDEREQLSLYIVDKATVIKKLVEENAVIQQRISSAKHEAKQLIALTRQITGEIGK